jgi:quinol monooxygenase YgiN
MKLLSGFSSVSFALAVLFAAAAPAAHADVKLANGTMLPDKPTFIVTYIEAAPADAEKAAALIKKHSAAIKKEPGNLRAEALRGTGRTNHFLLLEAWSDPAARQTHAKAPATIAFRQALQPLLYSPYDERPHVGLVAADPAKLPKGTGDTVYVVTHVDIIPPEQFAPCKRQVSEKGPCGNAMVEKLAADSRKHAGNKRFDILTQANRPNHMTLVEMWENPAAHNAHTVNTDTKNFRDALAGITPGSGVAKDPLFVLNPLTGSLYDEQLYKKID